MTWRRPSQVQSGWRAEWVGWRAPKEGRGCDRRRVREQDLRPFFTPKALADYLSISERTVRDMLSKQRIPSYKVEGQRRIDPLDVEKYLARNRNGRA